MSKITKITSLIPCIILSILVLAVSINVAFSDEGKSCDTLQEWRLFLKPFMGWSNFDDYWGDFRRNYCQYLEIEDVREELLASRALMRDAIYKCDFNTVQSEKKNYYKLEAELWYLRNFISTKEEANVPKNEAIVKSEMKSYFVNELKILGEDQTNEYFAEFQEKYATSFEKYKDCKDDIAWQDVKNKAIEVWETIKTNSKTTWEKERKAAKTRREEDKEKEEDKGAKEGSSSGFWSKLIKEHTDVEINQKEPKKGLDEIIEKFEEFTTGDKEAGKFKPSFSDVLRYQQQEEMRFDLDIASAQRKASYELLYKNTGDSIAKEFDKKLLRLNSVIEETNAKTFPKLKNLMEYIQGRQCAAN